jgi:hypothetical protein
VEGDQQQSGDKCWKEETPALSADEGCTGGVEKDPSATIIAPSVFSCFHVSVVPANRLNSGNLHRGRLVETDPVRCKCAEFAPGASQSPFICSASP